MKMKTYGGVRDVLQANSLNPLLICHRIYIWIFFCNFLSLSGIFRLVGPREKQNFAKMTRYLAVLVINAKKLTKCRGIWQF